jgi:hypothetical protein
MKRQTNHRQKENIYKTKHIASKGLISRMYKQLSKLDKDKLDKRFEQTFYPRRYLNGPQAHEKMSYILSP